MLCGYSSVHTTPTREYSPLLEPLKSYLDNKDQTSWSQPTISIDQRWGHCYSCYCVSKLLAMGTTHKFLICHCLSIRSVIHLLESWMCCTFPTQQCFILTVTAEYLDIGLSLPPKWSNSIPLPRKIPRVSPHFKAKDRHVTLGSTSPVKSYNPESASSGKMECSVKGHSEVSFCK